MRIHPLRQFLIGTPLPTSAHAEERLNNAQALAILSSDALSSVAYATQEIVLVLGMAGAAALRFTLPITGLIVALMLIVATSYRQTIQAYPQGGGSYRVSQENLGALPGLVAGASLAIDYVLTVAVSVAAGIAALTSLAPALEAHRIPLCLLAVAMVMLANLRGCAPAPRCCACPPTCSLPWCSPCWWVGACRPCWAISPPCRSPSRSTCCRAICRPVQARWPRSGRCC